MCNVLGNNLFQAEFLEDKIQLEENSTIALTSRGETLKQQYGLVIGIRGDRHNF